MSAESLTKTYRAFKSAASSLLARFGIDVGKKKQRRAEVIAIANGLIDQAMNVEDTQTPFNQRQLVVACAGMLKYFEEMCAQDEELIANHKIDPIKYNLSKEEVLNPFQEPKLSPFDKEILTKILDSDASFEIKVREIRAHQGRIKYMYYAENIFNAESQKRLLVEGARPVNNGSTRILDFSILKKT